MKNQTSSENANPIENAVSNAGIFLGLAFFLFFSLTGTALVAGVESGEIREKIVEPAKTIARTMEKSLSEGASESKFGFSSSGSVNINTSSSTSVTIDGKTYTNVKQKTTTPQGSVEIKYTYPTFPAGKSHEDAKKEMDEWWQKVQQENRQLNEQSKKSLEEFKAQSEADLEKFRQEGQQGLEEFRQEYGITP